MTPLRPTGFTVLYDADCSICRRARRWAEHQRQLVPLEFLAAGSIEARRRFPALDAATTRREITVVADDGAVLTDDRAWISVLWSVAATRPTAVRLLRPRRHPLFRSVKSATESIRAVTSRIVEPDRPSQLPAWPPPTRTGDH